MTTLGRQGIGVIQPFSGSDYPFVAPSADIKQLIADAYLAYSDDGHQLQRPFKIDWLYGFGDQVVTVPITPVHTYDVQISDANGVVVFNSLLADEFSSNDWGTRFRILQWSLGQTILRLVVFLEWADDETVITYDQYIEPTTGQLDERVCSEVLPDLRSIKIGSTAVFGNVVLRGGYNTKLDLTASSVDLVDTPPNEFGYASQPLRVSNKLTLHATPGAGAGRYPADCSEDSVYLRQLNSAEGDARGNFKIDLDPCYRAQQPIRTLLSADPRQVEIRGATLQLYNDCGPCCECDDFLACYEAIRKLRDRYADMVARAQSVRDIYATNVARWNAQLSCRNNRRLRAEIKLQQPNYAWLSAAYCNNTQQCIRNLVFEIDLSGCSFALTDYHIWYAGDYGDDWASIERVSQYSMATPEGSWPYFRFVAARVDPYSMPYINLGLIPAAGSFPATVGISVDAYAVPNPVINAYGSLVPGYQPGVGPGAESLQYRLVTEPATAQGYLTG